MITDLLLALISLTGLVSYLVGVGFTRGWLLRKFHRPRCWLCRGDRPISRGYGGIFDETGHANIFPDPNMGSDWAAGAAWPILLVGGGLWLGIGRPVGLAAKRLVHAGSTYALGKKSDPAKIASMERELGWRHD